MEKQYTNTGVGFYTLLFLLFLGLKLSNIINWSYWWVFAPLWGPALFAIFFIAIYFIVMAIKYRDRY